MSNYRHVQQLAAESGEQLKYETAINATLLSSEVPRKPGRRYKPAGSTGAAAENGIATEMWRTEIERGEL